MLGASTFINYIHLKLLDHTSCNRFHLDISHIFPQTHSRPCMKHWIPKWIFRLKRSVLYPSFRYILITILPPNVLHSPHCISMINDKPSLRYKSTIRHDIVILTFLRVNSHWRVKSHCL
ncbi:hypothetical protein ACHQM5_008314 [Ranunculus cassubicifolius]